MRSAEDGFPLTGPTARTLGIRSGTSSEADLPTVDGIVYPETGGMSVSPPPPSNLPRHRRPPEHGGTAKKIKLYALETAQLPTDLRVRLDPEEPQRHAFIEPTREMSLEQYEHALRVTTRRLWTPV